MEQIVIAYKRIIEAARLLTAANERELADDREMVAPARVADLQA